MALDEMPSSHRTATASLSGRTTTRARRLLACAPVLFLDASPFAQSAEAAHGNSEPQ